MTVTITPDQAIELRDEVMRRLEGKPIDKILIDATVWQVLRDHVARELAELWQECFRLGMKL